MLQFLKIENLALLDAVSLEFDTGFTAVTGETGAGKSVLLGALGLLSGARTDKTLIRKGADQLSVEGVLWFADGSDAAINAALLDLGLPACEDGSLILRRSIARNGPPRIQINGAVSTLAQLQALGGSWIDFHGPGEPQKLFQERRQLEMLDLFCEIDDQLEHYRTAFHQWRSLLSEIDQLRKAEQLDPEEIAFLQKQIDRIDAIDVSEASIAELELHFSRISQAQELASLVGAGVEGLTGDEGVVGKLGTVLHHIDQLAEIETEAVPLAKRLSSAVLELQDISDELEALAQHFDFDESAIADFEERMQLWQEVKRRFGGSVEAVIAKREELANRIGSQGDIEGQIAHKETAAAKQATALRKQAAEIRKARLKGAKQLGDKAAALLAALGFKKARLSIDIVEESELREYGDCACAFLFAPNAGQDLLPLNKIASSGETARVMLALKTVLAEVDATPLLVFDEVDANVGGEVGRTVGRELARLSGRHQVFCVTHLPQVAALAKAHFTVTKTQTDKSTKIDIAPIGQDADRRLEELARMLGDRESSSARAHAAELMADREPTR